jgi:arylsulfatase A-like enzyme
MPTQPNILIVMTDHQRADTILPEHLARTPNLDRFTGEGITFTRAYCPSPHCCPSRATFFTGLYPTRHGVWNNVLNESALTLGLKPGVRCWSEDLAAAGYDMHFVGKWHISAHEMPRDRAWTEHFVSAARGARHGLRWAEFRERANQPGPAQRGEGQILRPGYGDYTLYRTLPAADPSSHDEVAVRHAEEVLPVLGAGGQPWCLYVGLIGPHDPYNVPQQYLDLYNLDDAPLPANYADMMYDKPRLYQRMRNQIFGQLSEREAREGIRHFWAYCSYLDALFGRILRSLEATGQADNTLVLYCSDHGDYCGEHGLFAKGIPCFQGAYHVPCAVRWPKGAVGAGRRVDRFVSLADVAPTVLDVAGIAADRRFTGASLLPFLKGESPAAWRDAIFTQCNGVELYATQRSVMTIDYKYVFNGFDLDELYDLRYDAGEMHNLAADPAYAAIKRDLCRRLWQFAYQEEDTATSTYITVGLAPYGPASAFENTGQT